MKHPGKWVLLEASVIFVCVLLGIGGKFKAVELPPDAGQIARFSCIAHDEHQTVFDRQEEVLSHQEVRWMAEATATYVAGHEPAAWKMTIAMTAWEIETSEVKSKIGQMGSHCTDWAQQVNREIAKARKGNKR